MERKEEEREEDEIICLDESFFINDNYQLTTFTFGSHVLQLYCLHAASTDFDLTGQLVWPGAVLLNDYLSKNADILQGCSVIELGSGVGITGILCSRFCCKVVLTDHNEEVLKILEKNVELCVSTQSSISCTGLTSEKLEWGNSDQLNHILQENPEGFDLVLGADICFQQSSIPLLFDTVKQLLVRAAAKCKFILAYVSRTKVYEETDFRWKSILLLSFPIACMCAASDLLNNSMDALVVSEAARHGLQINEIHGTRTVVKNLEGVIFEITLRQEFMVKDVEVFCTKEKVQNPLS